MFERGFDIERFQSSTSKTKEARQEDFVRRQQQLLASYLLTASGAVRYIYNGVQGELAVLPDQYCYYL